MPNPRKLSVLFVGGVLSLLVLSVATCRLDMLIKPGAQLRPVMSVAPAEVRDSARAGSDDVQKVKVEIKNTGDGSFSWSATKDKGWIFLDPIEANAPGTLTVSLDAHGLAPATYQGVVTIHARGTDDSLATINVTFKVQRAGLIVLPGAVQHGTNVNSGEEFHDNLQISNSGNGVLVWTASKSKPWLTLGAITGTGSGTVPVTIRSTGLAAGTYTDEVVITAPGSEGSPARIPVTLSVYQPGLTIAPTSIRDSTNLGSITPRTDTLEVRNTGGGNMSWTVSKAKSFVSLSQTSGTAPPVDSVIVTLNPIGLPLGTYKDTVVFRSAEASNSPVKIPVQLDVVRPVLSVKPAAIIDATAPGDVQKRVHSLAITNAGRGEFSWSAIGDSPWITLSAAAGIVGDTIDVTLDPTGLAMGTYRGKIVVNAPGSVGSPATIDVTFTIQSPCNTSAITPDGVVNSSLKVGDCIAPKRPGSRAELYTVFAAPGDTLSFRMTATFNAYLVLTDGAGQLLAENDECPGEARTACIKNFAVTAAGQYIVEATTAAPGETGNYTLWVTLEEPPPPPQGLGQFRKDGVTAIAIGGSTPDDEAVFKGTVSDPNATDFVRLDVEIEPLGSPFTDAPTHQSAFVAASSGNVVVFARAGVTNNIGYHWQARSCDRTGRCSTWLKFGGNAESAADFSVAFAPPPAPPPPPPPPGGVAPGVKP